MNFHYAFLLWGVTPLVLFLVYTTTLRSKTHIVILIFLLFALAAPYSTTQYTKQPIQTKELIIALDISYSMRAKDLSPDRYTYALETIRALLEQEPGSHITLVAFTTNPLLLSPPTTDHPLILTALNSLRLENVLTKGTSLLHLFNFLSQMHPQDKELILLSDGGEEQNLDLLLAAVQKNQIHLNILALGSKQGATIPDAQGKALKDKEGNLVISRINPLLETLARKSEGNYFLPAGTPQQSASMISKTLQDTSNTIRKETRHTHEWHSIPLTIALILFFLIHTRWIKWVILIVTFLGISAEASPLDLHYLDSAYSSYKVHAYTKTLDALQKIKHPSLQSTLALAKTYYKLGDYKRAILIYQSIHSMHPKVKQQIYYELGNSYARIGRYNKAKMYYTKALQLGKDGDALHNLWTVMHLSVKNRGKTMPQAKSQKNNGSAVQPNQAEEEKETQTQSQGASGGGNGKNKSKISKKKHLHLKGNNDTAPHPLSSKVYEMINKGYIRENKPW